MRRAGPAATLEDVGIERAPAEELRRPLVVGTLVTWAMVVAPVPLQITGPALRVVGWSLSVASFLGCALAALRTRRARVRGGLLVLAALAVVGTVLTACDGFEGALLVLVALQLGGLVSRAQGVAWIAAQSLALGAAVAFHWNRGAALLLAPPYLGFQLLAFFIADVFAASAAARRDLERANLELAEAHRRSVEHGRLAERVRIAREIHDAVGHRLTALGMHLEVAARRSEGDAAESVFAARELARAALHDVRAAVERLREDERLDVATALRTLAADIPSPSVHVSVPDGVCRDDPERALTLLRFAQEVITNAVRHARAHNVWIDVAATDAALRLSARDDGVGTDDVRPGNGLRGMRERLERAGGQVEIVTRAGQGFAVHATLPARRS
jgi:signal transduction histidine kinase